MYGDASWGSQRGLCPALPRPVHHASPRSRPRGPKNGQVSPEGTEIGGLWVRVGGGWEESGQVGEDMEPRGRRDT